eukprot:TRINITY_DN3150_c3_g1_i1.p1 TRINITY_DN3150_c3_g1~~TRINITY_DN3150_c3_g1_i1.p1  ORF type:complete len:405 (-),score=90.98 TRINITY_DN3150_c3_g1_i1:62-1276(-)
MNEEEISKAIYAKDRWMPYTSFLVQGTEDRQGLGIVTFSPWLMTIIIGNFKMHARIDDIRISCNSNQKGTSVAMEVVSTGAMFRLIPHVQELHALSVVVNQHQFRILQHGNRSIEDMFPKDPKLEAVDSITLSESQRKRLSKAGPLIGNLGVDVICTIITELARSDPPSFLALGYTCKAFHRLMEQSIVQFGWPKARLYEEYFRRIITGITLQSRDKRRMRTVHISILGTTETKGIDYMMAFLHRLGGQIKIKDGEFPVIEGVRLDDQVVQLEFNLKKALARKPTIDDSYIVMYKCDSKSFEAAILQLENLEEDIRHSQIPTILIAERSDPKSDKELVHDGREIAKKFGIPFFVVSCVSGQSVFWSAVTIIRMAMRMTDPVLSRQKKYRTTSLEHRKFRKDEKK